MCFAVWTPVDSFLPLATIECSRDTPARLPARPHDLLQFCTAVDVRRPDEHTVRVTLQ